MSTFRGPFPIENNTFNTYFLTVYAYLTNPANLARLLISADNLADLNAQKTAWDTLFPLSMSESTATKQNRGERNDLREDIETTLTDIYDDIPKSVMNATDRSTLNLPLRDTVLTPRGAITDIPIADAKAIGGGSVKFRLRLTSDATRASRHPLADVIEMKYMLINPVTAAGGGGGSTPGTPSGTAPTPPPATADDCSLNQFSKKAVFTVHYGASAPGKVLYCFFRWVNLSNPANNSDWTGVRIVHLA
ncbi:MAG: hypothetical protein AB7G44_14800 [Bacteroidia bacterium]